jgi:hypothetical protein
MASVTTFDIAGRVFPIESATQQRAGHLNIGEFIGTGFWIDDEGHFLTCAHVLKLPKEQVATIAQPFSDERDHYIPIIKYNRHPKHDVAIGTARSIHRVVLVSLRVVARRDNVD